MKSVVLTQPGDRFWLRRSRKEDAAKLFEAVDESRENVGKWMPWLTPDYDEDDGMDWIERSAASWESGAAYEFVICDREDGDRISGCCGLNHINEIDRVLRAELRLDISRSERQQLANLLLRLQSNLARILAETTQP